MRVMSEAQSKLEKLSGILVVLAFLLLPITLAGHNLSFGLAVISLVLSGIFWTKRKILIKEPMVWALSFIFLLVCIGSFYSLSSWDGALGGNFLKYLKLFFGVLFIAAFLNEKTQKQAFFAFYFGVLFVLLCTYLNIWMNIPWSSTQNIGWGEDHTVFGNYITQNIMMSFFVLQNFYLIHTSKKHGLKAFYIALALLASVSVLYLSNGRTGYLVLLLGIMFYLAFALPKKWMVASIGAIAIIISVAFLTSERFQERYEKAKDETQLIFQQYGQGEPPTFTSIGARWYMWINSIEIASERPLTGWGLGSHGIKWCEKIPEPVWCEVSQSTPHNQFIFFAVELGVLGVLGFLFLLGVIFWAGWHGGKLRPLMMGFGAIFIGDSMVNASLWNAREYNFFIIMMCLLYSMIRFSSKKE